MNNNFITIDYIRFVVELSGITEFLEFAKDEQYYYVLNAAVDYGIVDELFPNSSVHYQKAIKVLKKYKSFKTFYKSRSYKEYQGLKNIDNLYHYIWPEEFEYIDNYISKEQLIRIMIKYKRWNYLKQHYNNIYHYIFDVLYPIPFDYNLPIQSVQAYIYMIENEMIEYPRSIVFKEYVKFNSNKIFNVFASNEEMNNTKEGIEYMNKQREIICLQKYGSKTYTGTDEFKKKTNKTVKEKYGVDNISQLEEIKQKKIETTRKNFGVDYPLQSKEVRNRYIEYWIKTRGVAHISQDPEIKEKKKQTTFEHFGVFNSLQSDVVKEKKKQTCLEKYGFEHPIQSPEIIQKGINTKRLNNSFNKSDSEDHIYEMLINLFNEDNIVRQYNSERYPFNCDFYIKILDMFIEYQGFWTHNNHPYNPDSEEDQKTLNIWKSKSEERKQYINAIDVWTYRDPLKRKTAKENNLNYVELWNMAEAEAFIDDLKKQLNLEQLDKQEEDNNINTLF